MVVIRKYKRKFEWWRIRAITDFPFSKLGQGIRWLLRTIFFDRIRISEDTAFGSNTRYYTKFSWGKLSFVLVFFSIILEVIHIFVF